MVMTTSVAGRFAWKQKSKSRRMVSVFRNPYYTYAFAFVAVLTIYLLGWSNLYPELRLELVAFILCSAVISVLVGLVLNAKIVQKRSFDPVKIPGFVYTLIVVGYVVEFVYAGSIPLLYVLYSGDCEEFFYKDFGIPFFHVFLIAVSRYTLACAAYNRFCVGSSRTIDSLFIVVVLSMDLLSGSRGTCIIGILILLFAYFLSGEKASRKRVVLGFLVFVLAAYGFGLIGQFRSAHGDETYANEILGISPRFENSKLPSPYLWLYVYLTSPLANLQYTMIHNPDVKYNITELIVFHMTNASISKRIMPDGGRSNQDVRIANYLTVGTIYFGPFNRFGWYGIFFAYFYLILFIVVHLVLFSFAGKHFVPAISVLNTLVLLCVFSDMLSDGIALTLLIPVAIGLFRIIAKTEKGKNGCCALPLID